MPDTILDPATYQWQATVEQEMEVHRALHTQSQPGCFVCDAIYAHELALLVSDWEIAAKKLSEWKEHEMQLRKDIVALAGEPSKHSNTQRLALSDGRNVVITRKQNYSLKNDQRLDEALAKFPEELSNRLVKWSPTLSVSTYNSLLDDYKTLLNDCLEIKDGAPTVEIKS